MALANLHSSLKPYDNAQIVEISDLINVNIKLPFLTIDYYTKSNIAWNVSLALKRPLSELADLIELKWTLLRYFRPHLEVRTRSRWNMG
jgi:hypothetical protein